MHSGEAEWKGFVAELKTTMARHSNRTEFNLKKHNETLIKGVDEKIDEMTEALNQVSNKFHMIETLETKVDKLKLRDEISDEEDTDKKDIP